MAPEAPFSTGPQYIQPGGPRWRSAAAAAPFSLCAPRMPGDLPRRRDIATRTVAMMSTISGVLWRRAVSPHPTSWRSATSPMRASKERPSRWKAALTRTSSRPVPSATRWGPRGGALIQGNMMPRTRSRACTQPSALVTIPAGIPASRRPWRAFEDGPAEGHRDPRILSAIAINSLPADTVTGVLVSHPSVERDRTRPSMSRRVSNFSAARTRCPHPRRWRRGGCGELRSYATDTAEQRHDPGARLADLATARSP